MTDTTIPREALEAARIAWLESASEYNRLDDSIRAACLAMLRVHPKMKHMPVAWLESASEYNRLDDSIRAACLARLRNWPGMHIRNYLTEPLETSIVLPLTENTNV